VEFNRGTRLTLRATPRALTAVAELTEIVRSISRRIAEVGLGDKQAIHDQYADILRLGNRLASMAAEDKAWTRDALDVRNRSTFDCAEWDVSTEELIRTHSNAGDNSVGEQEKLMAFCLAGALSFNLASPESADNRPVFAQLMLDEAFSKSDPQFAQQTLQAFRKFGFHLVIVATGRTPPPSSPTSTAWRWCPRPSPRGATPDRSPRWRPGRSRSSPRCARRCARVGGAGAGRNLTRATPGPSSRAPDRNPHRRLRIRRRSTAPPESSGLVPR